MVLQCCLFFLFYFYSGKHFLDRNNCSRSLSGNFLDLKPLTSCTLNKSFIKMLNFFSKIQKKLPTVRRQLNSRVPDDDVINDGRVVAPRRENRKGDAVGTKTPRLKNILNAESPHATRFVVLLLMTTTHFLLPGNSIINAIIPKSASLFSSPVSDFPLLPACERSRVAFSSPNGAACHYVVTRWAQCYSCLKYKITKNIFFPFFFSTVKVNSVLFKRGRRDRA